MTARDIGSDCSRKGLFPVLHPVPPQLLLSAATASQIKQGTYVLDGRMSMSSLFAKLTSGNQRLCGWSEGYTVQQIAKQLEKQEIVSADDFFGRSAQDGLTVRLYEGEPRRDLPYRGLLVP